MLRWLIPRAVSLRISPCLIMSSPLSGDGATQCAPLGQSWSVMRAAAVGGAWNCGQWEMECRSLGPAVRSGNLGPRREQEEDHMHGQERGRLATGTLTEFDHSYAGTIAELGYPTRSAPRAWRAREDRRGARRQVCHEPEARRRDGAASRRAPPRARQGPGRDDGGPWLPQEPREAQRVGRRARAGTAKAPRSEAREGGDSPRGEGAGRRRARGEGRVRRGDGRATRRVENGTLPLAQGDDGR